MHTIQQMAEFFDKRIDTLKQKLKQAGYKPIKAEKDKLYYSVHAFQYLKKYYSKEVLIIEKPFIKEVEVLVYPSKINFGLV